MVTPYQAQVSLISESIREEYPEMAIGSVDGLQGQEREVCMAVRDGSALTLGHHPHAGPVQSQVRGGVPERV